MNLIHRYWHQRSLLSCPSHQESARSEEYSNRWLAVPQETRSKIKHDSLLALGSSAKQVGTVAAQLVAAIATVELPSGQWPELVEVLLSFMGQTNVNLRVATLQAIGFICESIVRPTPLDRVDLFF